MKVGVELVKIKYLNIIRFDFFLVCMLVLFFFSVDLFFM